MRSEKQFNQCSLDKSVNFSVEKFNEDTFINWAKHIKSLEENTNIFPAKIAQHAFKRRRRHWVFIIPCHNSVNLDTWLLEMSNIGSKQALQSLISQAVTNQQREDLLSIKNSILLFKALKKERVREMDFCIDGFDKFQTYYKHFLLGPTRKIMV